MIALRKFAGSMHVAIAIALVVGYLASWRLQMEAGTIGLFHDWSISPSAAQNVAYAAQLFNGWYRWILGEPVIYPTEYPVRFSFALAGALGLGGDVVSHAFVFLAPAAAFFCAWLLARQVSGSQIGAIAAGLFYSFNPVMLNKLVSGQASYVVGYCALPLALWAYERAVVKRSFVSAIGFGGALAIAGVQIQLGIAGALLTILGAVIPHHAARFGKRLALLVTGFAVALTIHAPTLVGVIGGAPGYENRAQFSNSAAYVSMNSVALADAVQLMGYLTRYADVAIQQWAWLWSAAMWILVAGVVIGIATAPKRFRLYSALVLVAVLAFISGTRSPFSSGIVWLFQHVRYMQVFRELYHLMAVVALIYACGIALFMRFAETRGHSRWALYAVTSVALLLVSAPMLSGDASGWIRAFPLEQAYGDALKEQTHGSSRVLWLPMDQPLSFDGHGAGVDPMAVTPRGSLWDYSLNWPLTAVDADIHDGGDVKTALRALSVGDVVERYGMQSELFRFTVDGTDTEPFLSRAVPLNLPVSRHYRQSTGYAVADSVPFTSARNEVAIVPQRFAVCSDAITLGYAPIAFSDTRPADLPYTFMYDAEDVPEEAVELAGAAQPLQTTSIDARLGFGPVDVWWWHRKDYADVPGATISFGRHVNTLIAGTSYRNSVAIVAWIATPASGRVRIAVDGRSVDIDTNGSGEWRSRAVTLGAITQGMPISVTSLDSSAEVAVRAFTVLERPQYENMLSLWRRTRDRASARVAIGQREHEVLYREGTSRDLGLLQNGAFYRLEPATPYSDMRVQNTDGFPLARITPTAVIFRGTGGIARIITRHHLGRWRLYKVLREPLRLPKPSAKNSSRLFMWNWAFGDWRTENPSRRFASAIGTTIFEFPRPESRPVVYYSKAAAFRAAYELGTAVLLLVLCLGGVRLALRAKRSKVSTVEFSTKDVTA